MAQTNSGIAVKHEDLSNELSLLDHGENVLTSILPSGSSPGASKYEFPMDIRVPGKLGGVGESTAVDRNQVQDQFANRVKAAGVVQQFRFDHGVTDRAKQVENAAGVKNLAGEARTRALKQLKDGLELTALSGQEQFEAAVGSGSYLDKDGVVRPIFNTRGFVQWGNPSAQLSLPVPAQFRPSAAQAVSVTSLAAHTEVEFRAMLVAARKKNKRPVKLLGMVSVDYAQLAQTWFEVGTQSATQIPTRRFNHEGSPSNFKIGVRSYDVMDVGAVMFKTTDKLSAVRNAATLTGSGTTNGSANVTLTSTAGVQPFMTIKGPGIPAGAYVLTVNSPTQITLSADATATGTVTLTLGREDHAVFLETTAICKKMNGGVDSKDLSNDGSGDQGFLQCFASFWNGLPSTTCTVFTP
jgi:hypothetical protein